MKKPILVEPCSILKCSATAASIKTAGWPQPDTADCRGNCCFHGNFDKDVWELYHIDNDFSQADDLAAKLPQKLQELQEAFLVEAKKYNVLPLDDRLAERFDTTLRPNPLAGLTKFTYGPGVTGLSESSVLNTHGVPFSITADVEVGQTGADGVLAAIGGIISGWSLYVKDGRPTFYYNTFDVEHAKIQSSEVLSPGKATVRAEFTPVEPGPESLLM